MMIMMAVSVMLPLVLPVDAVVVELWNGTMTLL